MPTLRLITLGLPLHLPWNLAECALFLGERVGLVDDPQALWGSNSITKISAFRGLGSCRRVLDPGPISRYCFGRRDAGFGRVHLVEGSRYRCSSVESVAARHSIGDCDTVRVDAPRRRKQSTGLAIARLSRKLRLAAKT